MIIDHNGRDRKLHLFRHSVEHNHKNVERQDFKILGKDYINNAVKLKISEALYCREHKAKASLAKWLSVRLQTKWFWVRVQLQSLKLHILCLLRARSSLIFRRLQSVDSLWNTMWYDKNIQTQAYFKGSGEIHQFKIIQLTVAQ